jgi:hypothetical protein
MGVPLRFVRLLPLPLPLTSPALLAARLARRWRALASVAFDADLGQFDGLFGIEEFFLLRFWFQHQDRKLTMIHIMCMMTHVQQVGHQTTAR